MKNFEKSTPAPKVNEPVEPWPCDWDSHELQQLRRDAACSFRDNLIWLEEMTEFAAKLSAQASSYEDAKPTAPRQD